MVNSTTSYWFWTCLFFDWECSDVKINKCLNEQWEMDQVTTITTSD